MNNGKYHTEQYKQRRAEAVDRRLGAVKTHTKRCECCGELYIFVGRRNTKAYERSRFCSRSCANNRQAYWNDNAKCYTTICFQHYEKKCANCGFDVVIDVHHIDNDRTNNDITNLIPLCPNCHAIVHRLYNGDVAQLGEHLPCK